MDTKALRQKILDLAIRGKLVPQDPNDEPASVLLERIREQKMQMVKEGKLKAKDIKNDTIIFVGEDNLHYEKFQDGTVKCIEDEIPFEVPEGWGWARISTVALFMGGYAYKSSTYIPDSQNILIRIGNIKNNNLNPLIAKTCISDEYAAETDKYLVRENDILFTMTGTRGKRDYFYSCRIEKSDLEGIQLFLNQRVGRLRLISTADILPSYFVNTIQSSYVLDAIFATETGNVNQGNIGSTATMNLLIPVAPTEEQYKIQEKSLSILSTIEQYDIDTEDLSKIINKLRSKILDLAIRGKLVPQDPNDEPASVLLERIRTEKEELIKQGKIKRDKKESIIFRGDDNSYYEKIGDKISEYAGEDIPLGWSIASFSQANMFSSETIDPSHFPEEMFELYSVPNFELGVPEVIKGQEIGSSKQSICENDVLVCKINPRINRVWITGHSTSYRILGSSEWIVFRNAYLHAPYMQFYFSSSYFRELLLSNVSGVGGSLMRAQPESVKKYPVLIPPYKEQVRIADKILELFMKLDDIGAVK